MADLHISPYETKEVNAAKASYAQGRLKVQIIHVENRNDHDCAICACIIYSVYEPSYICTFIYMHLYVCTSICSRLTGWRSSCSV